MERKRSVADRSVRDEKIIQLYKQGVSTKQLGVDFGMSQTGVGNVLKKAGYDLTRKHLTESQQSEIVRLYQAGQNMREIGRSIGFSPVAVRIHLERVGIAKRSIYKLTDEEQQQLLRNYEGGESSEQIAKRLGISSDAVRDAIRRQGGKMREVWPKKEVKPAQLFNPNYDPQELPDCRFAGIYRFTNKINGKVYIGQAGYIYKRYYQHREMKAAGAFSKALKKYGIGNFTFEVLERVDNLSLLDAREQYWMDHHQSYEQGKGYNLARIAGSVRGIKRSPEDVAAMRERMEAVYPLISQRLRKAVRQIDPATGLIVQVWSRARDASIELGISELMIQEVCRNEPRPGRARKTLYGGYWWEYTNESAACKAQ